MDELTHIHTARQAITIAEQQLEDAVANARSAGYSWADIGQSLGISRQAAFKRFGTVTSPFTGEEMSATSTTELPAIAEQFITHLASGNEEAAMGMLHHRVRTELSWDKITPVWEEILGDIGAFERFEDTQVTTVRGTREKKPALSSLTSKLTGTAVVVTTLVHEAGEVMARIAIDTHGAIVGILFLPMDATEFPF